MNKRTKEQLQIAGGFLAILLVLALAVALYGIAVHYFDNIRRYFFGVPGYEVFLENHESGLIMLPLFMAVVFGGLYALLVFFWKQEQGAHPINKGARKFLGWIALAGVGVAVLVGSISLRSVHTRVLISTGGDNILVQGKDCQASACAYTAADVTSVIHVYRMSSSYRGGDTCESRGYAIRFSQGMVVQGLEQGFRMRELLSPRNPRIEFGIDEACYDWFAPAKTSF
jgi:hypothetical protein